MAAVSGCFMLKWINFLVLMTILAAAACSDKGSTVSQGSTGGEAAPDAPPSQNYAVPQEELARTADAIKLTGNIIVKDYTIGLLQIDATLPVDGAAAPPHGVPPITVARFPAPGEFSMYLPPKTEAVNLALILDLKGDGPDAEDPKLVYEKNPIEIDGDTVTGIEMVIDSTQVALPPSPPPKDGIATEPTAVAPVNPSSAEDALSLTQGVGEVAPDQSSDSQTGKTESTGSEGRSGTAVGDKPVPVPVAPEVEKHASAPASTAPLPPAPDPAKEETSRSQTEAGPATVTESPKPHASAPATESDIHAAPAGAAPASGLQGDKGAAAVPLETLAATPDPLDESFDTAPK